MKQLKEEFRMLCILMTHLEKCGLPSALRVCCLGWRMLRATCWVSGLTKPHMAGTPLAPFLIAIAWWEGGRQALTSPEQEPDGSQPVIMKALMGILALWEVREQALCHEMWWGAWLPSPFCKPALCLLENVWESVSLLCQSCCDRSTADNEIWKYK